MRSKHFTLGVTVSVYVLWDEEEQKVLIFMSVFCIIDCALVITVNWESNRGNETDCWRITLHQKYQRAV